MLSVLVIDDNALFRFILADWLQSEGCYAITAENGMDGIQLAQTRRPDLIFCNIHLSMISGIEVLKRLRRTRSTSHIPFYFLASESRLRLCQMQQLGADGVVPKDAELDEFRRVVRRIRAKDYFFSIA